MQVYVRICQECLFPMERKNPQDFKDDKWKDATCMHCGSEGSLDYGSYMEQKDFEEKRKKFLTRKQD